VVQNVAAEAAMDTQPWDYWEADGVTPKGRAGAAVRRIETVLDRSPRDAGAIHLYIHLVEASKDPWRAEDGAQRLDRATPQAGHLVHMPAHIYYGVGRFRDSIRANIAAAAADEAYIAAANPSPIYRYGYYPHNVHFVLTSAAMAGDARTTLQYADKLDEAVPMEMAAAVVLAQAVKAAPWFAKAQFADPASVLAAERPPEGVTYVEGAWRYARGVAQARAGNGDGARVEAAAITQLIETGDFKAMNEANIPAQTILDIYRRIVEARALMAESKFADAIPVLREAVAMQTQVPYTEPPYLYYPLRRTLAGAYLMNGQPAVAEMEFLLTLTESPNDAYAYWGLAEARRQRGDRRGAAAARTLFQQAYLGRGSLNAGAL
jgi:tetratricopeptide (TPR) repeat protein